MADSYTHDTNHPKKTTTIMGHKQRTPGRFSIINLSETETTIICTVGPYLYAHHKGKTIPLPMELPKSCLAEYGGTPGPAVKASAFLTLSRAVKFPDGTQLKAGTTIKAVKWPEQNDPDIFTFLTDDGKPWEISGKCIAELEGTPGEAELARAGDLTPTLSELQKRATLQEIMSATVQKGNSCLNKRGQLVRG